MWGSRQKGSLKGPEVEKGLVCPRHRAKRPVAGGRGGRAHPSRGKFWDQFMEYRENLREPRVG